MDTLFDVGNEKKNPKPRSSYNFHPFLSPCAVNVPQRQRDEFSNKGHVLHTEIPPGRQTKGSCAWEPMSEVRRIKDEEQTNLNIRRESNWINENFLIGPKNRIQSYRRHRLRWKKVEQKISVSTSFYLMFDWLSSDDVCLLP